MYMFHAINELRNPGIGHHIFFGQLSEFYTVQVPKNLSAIPTELGVEVRSMPYFNTIVNC